MDNQLINNAIMLGIFIALLLIKVLSKPKPDSLYEFNKNPNKKKYPAWWFILAVVLGIILPLPFVLFVLEKIRNEKTS